MNRAVIIITAIVVFSFCVNSIFAQLMYNNGATVNAKNGVVVYVGGAVQNESGTIIVEEELGNISEMIIMDDFINNSIAEGSGYYRVFGNWENNNTFNAETGTVFLEGENQLLTGSQSTNFFNLTLDGSGIKTQTIDQFVDGVLNLNHLELATETHNMFVLNTDVNAIIRTDGFVSSLNAGFLSRNTLAADTYLFPVGSSVGTERYRPVEITPNDANSNTYTVRMANVDATTEGFDREQLGEDICETNEYFYHRINRTSGSTAIDLQIFYDDTEDGEWDGIANWNTSPDQWEVVLGSTSTPGSPFYIASVNGWNTFNETPYILYRESVAPEFADLGPYCVGETPDLLPTTSLNGFEGSWSPENIDTSEEGSFTYIFTPVLGECTEEYHMIILVEPSITPVFDDFGPYCVGETPDDLPLISNNGIEGTWEPPVINTAAPGTTSYTFTPTVTECTETFVLEVLVEDVITPDFTQLGPYCEGETPDALPATSNNGIAGTWDPAVIDTNILGSTTYTFNPTSGECTEPTTMEVVVEESVTPIFDVFGPYCEGETPDLLPATSNNGISGTWSPSEINTSTEGSFDYTFIPDAEECADEIIITVIIEEGIVPEFTQLGPYCVGDPPGTLPTTSINGVEGTWDPAVINTSVEGTTIHTFTPTEVGCYQTITMEVEVGDNVIPTFTQLGPYCEGETPDALPATSNNGIAGTWDPAVIDTNILGSTTYTFTPTSGECTEPTTMEVVVEESVTPIFDVFGPYCEGETPDLLPATSNNGISGTWSPSEINTSTEGSFDYTFTPDAEECADEIIITVIIEESIVPEFAQLGPYCVGDPPGTLPTTSINGVEGTWDPAVINTSVEGTTIHTFTPTEVGCYQTITMEVEVGDNVIPTFTQLGPYCLGETPDALPATSNNGIAGTWSPDVIDTNILGSTTYTFTPTSGECTEPTTMEVIVEESITPIFDDFGPYCVGETPDLLPGTSNNGISGTWSPSEINTSTEGSFDYTFTPDAEECADVTIITVLIEEGIVPTFTQLGPYCEGETPDALPTTSNNGIEGSWSPEVIDTNILGDTTYTFTPSAGECAVTTTMEVVVEEGITPIFDDFGPYCEGETPDLLPDESNNGISGTWNPTEINTSTAGSYDFTFTPDAEECAGEVVITVIIEEGIVPSFTQLGPYCEGETPDALPTTSNNGIEGSWSPEVIDTNILGSTTYTFIPTSGECAVHTTMEVVVEEIIAPVFDDFGPYCEGETPDLLPGTSNNGISGIWAPAEINTSTAGTYDFTFTPDAGECADVFSISIIIEETPDVSIDEVPDLCIDDNPEVLSGLPEGGDWSGPGVTTSGADIVFDPSDAGIGSHTVTYTVTDGLCSGTASIIINVFDTPDATIDPVSDLCEGEVAITLTAASEGGTWSGDGIIDSEDGLFSPNVAGVGSHVITYTVGSGNCVDTDQITIVVKPLPVISIQPAGPFCYNDNAVTLSATPDGGVWSGDGITDASQGLFDPSEANIGENTITYLVTEDGCSAIDSITITIYESIDASIDPVDPICYDDITIQLTANTDGGNWSGDHVSNTGLFDVGAAGVGVHNVQYHIAGNCGDSDMIDIIVHPSDIDASYVTEEPKCIGGEDGVINISVDGGTPPYFFVIDDVEIPEFNYISGLSSGSYDITIIDDNGCYLVLEDILIADGTDDCIFIPNAFTPNDDGYNDYWEIQNINAFRDHHVQIFNRWGQEVFSARYGQDPWDGTFNGKKMPTGSYIFVIRLNPDRDAITGIVTLVR